ncbi:hypothetical protein B0G66_1501 [Bacillus badius]|nr:hypothetical protein B0G66_1501 [Bacillus badius]
MLTPIVQHIFSERIFSYGLNTDFQQVSALCRTVPTAYSISSTNLNELF